MHAALRAVLPRPALLWLERGRILKTVVRLGTRVKTIGAAQSGLSTPPRPDRSAPAPRLGRAAAAEPEPRQETADGKRRGQSGSGSQSASKRWTVGRSIKVRNGP